MHRGKEVSLVLAGVLVGTAIAGPGANAAAGILAERSANEVYVNGQRVELEAYSIGGHNYVKLRDVGKAVNFNVYWDGTVQIDSAAPYTGEAPVAEVAPTVAEVVDHSAQANPTVFTGTYTRAAFNALRECVLTGEGDPVAMSQDTKAAVRKVDAAIGTYPGYDFTTEPDGLVQVTPRYSSAYGEAAKICRDFIAALDGRSDHEKLAAFADYVSDRLEYQSQATATPAALFTEPGIHRGNCMSYAHGFKFLCNLAGIPCVYVHSSVHQWCEVYVDGAWYPVDLTSYDSSRSIGWDEDVLKSYSDMQGEGFRQTEPLLTQFAKEVLVPGSTK